MPSLGQAQRQYLLVTANVVESGLMLNPGAQSQYLLVTAN
ncbi:MAG: hypothetical protein ACJAWL_002156 [Motiliproteus sp.]|jgi:hypothetical protein